MLFFLNFKTSPVESIDFFTTYKHIRIDIYICLNIWLLSIEFIVANGIYAPCSMFMFNQHKIPKTISNKISLSFFRIGWNELKNRSKSDVNRSLQGRKSVNEKRYQIKVLVNVCKSKPYPLIKSISFCQHIALWYGMNFYEM